MIAPIATLVAGLIVGYLAQRSRMCFVGGIRDVLLVRDAALLKGLAAFGLTAWVAFPLADLFTGTVNGTVTGTTLGPFAAPDATAVALTVASGFGVGYLSTLANGCPLRQHVLAAQGVASSVAYLFGFFTAAAAFHAWIGPTLARLLP